MLYLTARAIGQAETTKNYIESLKQDNLKLPPGPIIMSPDRLLRSFSREIILKKPQVFKIACLSNIRQLFPHGFDPFYAGFGNRETDAVSYRDVGVPLGKIFIINPEGEVHHYESQQYQKTYQKIAEMCDMIFPP
jgi:phosphatidate phosphatase LPIN